MILAVTTPAEPPRLPKLGYVPALDGVRALAVTAVIAAHMAVSHAEGGTMGVFVFFVLSGFLITTLLLQEEDRSGAVNLRRFYAKRAFRLFPALVLVLVATDVYLAFDRSNPVRSVTIGSTPAVVFYYANWEWFAHGVSSLGWFGHMWSLAVEEQFYLLWPFVLLGLRTLPTRTKSLLLAAGCLVSLVLRAVAARHFSGGFFGTPMIADQLLYGALAAVLFHDLHTRPTVLRLARLAQLPALAVLAIFFVAQGTDLSSVPRQFRDGPGVAAMGLATALLLLDLVARQDGLLARVLATPFLVAIGRVSYGMYLWHILLCFGLSEKVHFGHGLHPVYWILGYGLTYGVAWLSHRFLEAPLMQRGNKVLSARTQPGLATAV